MLFVLPGILFIGLVLLLVWSLFFRTSVRQERSAEKARQRAERIEGWLSSPNEPLYCASCDEAFRGPLDENGCPRCHSRILVIPIRATADSHVQELGRRLPILPTPTAPEPEQAKGASYRAPAAVSEEAAQKSETLPQGKRGK